MKRKIDDLGRIVLPAEMKKEIGLNNGSEAKIEIEDHKIIITKPDSIDYKAIVDKAIEYLETQIQDGRSDSNLWLMGCYDEDKKILEILKGEKTN